MIDLPSDINHIIKIKIAKFEAAYDDVVKFIFLFV